MPRQQLKFRPAVTAVWAVVIYRKRQKNIKHHKFGDSGPATIAGIGGDGLVTWQVDLDIDAAPNKKVSVRWFGSNANGKVIAVATRNPM